MSNLDSYKFFIGGSMQPTLKTGFKVRTEPVRPEDILIGDIVIIDRGKYLCHRVVGKYRIGKRLYFLEKGDNINCGLNWVSGDRIVGRVREIETLDRAILKDKDFAISDIERIKLRLFSIIYGIMHTTKLLLFGGSKNWLTRNIYFSITKIYSRLLCPLP